MKYWRIRMRNQSGRTQIIPIRFWSEEEAESFCEQMNAENNGFQYEMAGCKYC